MQKRKGIVISDCHHWGLWQAQMFLFEKRLGYELYRPFGLEWAVQGFMSDPWLNDVTSNIRRLLTTPSFLSTTDPDMVSTLSVPIGRTISLKEARERASEIRYVVTSQHDTQQPLFEFVGWICPFAKLIRQCGNPNEASDWTRDVLCSDLQTYEKLKETHNIILYHQEFPRVYFQQRQWDHPAPYRVCQYINWAHQDQKNREFYLWFKALCKEIGMTCYEHGRGGEDGEFDYHDQLVRRMIGSGFTLSHKWWDGYGMIVHQSYAASCPVICCEPDYRTKLAGKLMRDMETAVFISEDEKLTKEKLIEATHSAVPMGRAARKRFDEVVDFEKEAREIERWLEKLS